MVPDPSEIRLVILHLQLTAAKHLAVAFKYAAVLGASATIPQRRALSLECHKAEALSNKLAALFTEFLPLDSRDAQRTLRAIQYEALIEKHDIVMNQYHTCIEKLELVDQDTMPLGLAQCHPLLKRATKLLTAAKRVRAGSAEQKRVAFR